MGYHNIHAVILIPAARLAAANTYLSRHGYGTDIFKKQLILIADPDSQPARGYGGILRVDPGGLAVLKKVIEGQATATC